MLENLLRPAMARSFGKRLKDFVLMAVSDPSILNSNYVLPPDYGIMSETAEVFTKALLLGMDIETDQTTFAKTTFAEPDPDIFLPYEEALKYMRNRLPVDRETYYALTDKMRYRAFTVSRLADGDAVQRVQNMLSETLEQGSGIQDFLKLTEGQLADAAGMGRGAGWYYETVYRTNTATAYNVGRAIGFEEVEPIALELIGIDDSRQTDICHSLTAPPFRRPYDDPVWDHLWPPFHFNCRTTIRAIYDKSEIDDAGGPEKFYTKNDPDFTPADGFGTYPIDKSDSWWDLTDAMKERAEEYGLEAEFMDARERLIEPENSQFVDPLEEAARKEAEDYARNVLGIEYADYTGIDSRVANEWNKNLENNLREFPELKDMLNFTGSIEAQNELIQSAYYSAKLSEIQKLYPKMNDTFSKQLAASLTKEYMEKLNITENLIARSVLLKEPLQQYSGIGIRTKYGQNLQVMLEQLANDVSSGFHPLGTASVKGAYDHDVGHMLDNLLNLRNNPEMIALWNKYPKEVIARDLSIYGSKKINDFIASGWAEYKNNSEKRYLSIQIGDLILKRLWKR